MIQLHILILFRIIDHNSNPDTIMLRIKIKKFNSPNALWFLRDIKRICLVVKYLRAHLLSIVPAQT